jgi:RNase P subunit RPR2
MGCLRLRGPATAMDMGKVLRDQSWLVQTLGSWGWMNHTLRDWKGVVCKNCKTFWIGSKRAPNLRVHVAHAVFLWLCGRRTGRFSAYVEGELCQMKMMLLCCLEEETIDRWQFPVDCQSDWHVAYRLKFGEIHVTFIGQLLHLFAGIDTLYILGDVYADVHNDNFNISSLNVSVPQILKVVKILCTSKI